MKVKEQVFPRRCKQTVAITVQGVGWVSPDHCGCLQRAVEHRHPGGRQLRDLMMERGYFRKPFKSFGRFDLATQLTCCSVALAFHDAGVAYGPEHDQVGILGSSTQGCLPVNQAYFRDYLDSGRSLARGNLFIYTLPSSPLSEAAIHFGLRGPLFHIDHPSRGIDALLASARGVISRGEIPSMLALFSDREQAICFFLSAGDVPPAGRGSDLEQVIELFTSPARGDAVIDRLARLRSK